jgi:hypothetical protein
MVQKRQLEEVHAAGIEDLENCPFCDFVTTPNPDSTVFSCYNPQCMRDSCRFEIIRTVFYSELHPHVHSNSTAPYYCAWEIGDSVPVLLTED